MQPKYMIVSIYSIFIGNLIYNLTDLYFYLKKKGDPDEYSIL
jgi:hypothetical protein